MNITTKFNLGDTVFPIYLEHLKRWVDCSACGGGGFVKLHGGKYACPGCHGRRGEYVREGCKMVPQDVGVVGKVSVEMYADGYRDDDLRNAIRYMLSTTGVGSGACWVESCLYASADEAKAACDDINARMSAAGVCGNLDAAVEWLRKEGLR